MPIGRRGCSSGRGARSAVSSRGRYYMPKGCKNYVKLHLAGESIVIHQTMSSLEDILPAEMFFVSTAHTLLTYPV